ncbi:MAG: hypothetical protein HZA31_11620 [Opitutae bacterium]|nr:hypothetical protein [Opitutae bacterium]
MAFIGWKVASNLRNIVYWDEFDSVLAFLLRIEAGAAWPDIVQHLLCKHNEHITLVSRLLFAGSYWLTGTINFQVIGIIGNLFLLALCVVLVVAAGSQQRRIRLGVVLAWMVFSLQHYESLFWAGASIDHFQVHLWAALALISLGWKNRVGFLLAMLCAQLAVFTLAHGVMVFPIGLLLLLFTRRWREALLWTAWGVLIVSFFLKDFHSLAHHGTQATLTQMLLYWLRLLGASPAVGNYGLALWLGVVVMLWVLWLIRDGTWRREAWAVSLALYMIGAAALVSVGRANLSGGLIAPRYHVISALLWSLALFLALERWSDPRRPWRLLLCCLPLFLVFNVRANWRYYGKGAQFARNLEFAAMRFKRFGTMRQYPFLLHPNPDRADRLLRLAMERRIYRLPTICRQVRIRDLQETQRIACGIDQIEVNERSAHVRAWAMLPNTTINRKRLFVVLRRNNHPILAFSAVSEERPDRSVGTARATGLRFTVTRDRLPSGTYTIGFAVGNEAKAYYMMTPQKMVLPVKGGDASPKI